MQDCICNWAQKCKDDVQELMFCGQTKHTMSLTLLTETEEQNQVSVDNISVIVQVSVKSMYDP